MHAVTLRGLAATDLPALDRLLREVEAVDRTDEHYNLADLQEEWDAPLLDGSRDWIGAFDAADPTALVGATRLFPRAPGDAELLTYVTGCTHPDRRDQGIGTMLARALAARVAERHAALAPHLPAVTRAEGLSADTAQAEVLAAVGMHPDRYSFTLGVDTLADVPDPGATPDGLLVRGYDPVRDEDALRDVHNEVFRDHPGSSPWTPEDWRGRVLESRGFRGDVTRLVVEADRPDVVVGYVQVEEYDAVQEATGRREAWIARVGTVRAHRGRGLAAHLLRVVLLACRDAGYDRAGLNVDSENPTGALGVYERAGFRVEQRWTGYLRTDAPLAAD